MLDRGGTPGDRQDWREGVTTTTTAAKEQARLRALTRANHVRIARADLKRRIAHGRLSAAEVMRAVPWEAASWQVGELLKSQPGWGSTRCRQLLAHHQISEIKPVGRLTERQRQVLAAHLERRGLV